MKELKLLVPGAVAAGDTLEVTAPYNFKTIAVAEIAGRQDIETALGIAEKLYRNKRSWLPLPERLHILEKTAEIMQGEFEELAVAAA